VQKTLLPKANSFASPADAAIYSQALSILDSLESSPSCYKLAASNLLSSCEDIKNLRIRDSNGHDEIDAEKHLDQIKSLFAARIAVCELLEARADFPSACSELTPSTQTKRPSGVGLVSWRIIRHKVEAGRSLPDFVSDIQFGQCLKGLESRPQWWTSYSNAKQNAVIMCQAVRHDIERGKLQFY
jgi:hypothetical protein